MSSNLNVGKIVSAFLLFSCQSVLRVVSCLSNQNVCYKRGLGANSTENYKHIKYKIQFFFFCQIFYLFSLTCLSYPVFRIIMTFLIEKNCKISNYFWENMRKMEKSGTSNENQSDKRRIYSITRWGVRYLLSVATKHTFHPSTLFAVHSAFKSFQTND